MLNNLTKFIVKNTTKVFRLISYINFKESKSFF